MDDRTGENSSTNSAPLSLLSGGKHRWHVTPDDDSLFVLDDGTGDVELRFSSADDALQAILLRRDEEVERFELPCAVGEDDRARVFRAWLEAAIERHAASSSGESVKGKTRFIVSFGAAQIEKLRATADHEGIPVAEVVRRAVEAYLAAR